MSFKAPLLFMWIVQLKICLKHFSTCQLSLKQEKDRKKTDKHRFFRCCCLDRCLLCSRRRFSGWWAWEAAAIINSNVMRKESENCDKNTPSRPAQITSNALRSCDSFSAPNPAAHVNVFITSKAEWEVKNENKKNIMAPGRDPTATYRWLAAVSRFSRN